LLYLISGIPIGHCPEAIQKLADKNFEIMKANPRHPSIRLKNAGIFWSARIGLQHRALAKEREEGLIWVWIGHHLNTSIGSKPNKPNV
jgi:hypothetical protein